MIHTTTINGCTEYVEANVSIFFQKGHVSCKYCPLLETYARKQCRKSGEYIVDDNLTGWRCPLMINGIMQGDDFFKRPFADENEKGETE